MSEQNVELTRRAFEYAEQHGGVPDWDLMAPDVVIVNLPDAPWQPSPGIKGMREWIAFAEDVAEEFVMEVDEIEDLGEDLVLVSGRLRMKFRATGLEQEAAIVQLCSIVDGKLKRLEAHYTREQALEAAGLSDSGD